jgi:signal transduction histidine kinase
MVDIIASRAAAFRLTWIIAALLVPIAFLGYFMGITLLGESKTTRLERDGAKLVQLLIPIYIGAAAERVEPTDVEDLLRNGRTLAQNLNVSEAFDQLAEQLKTSKPVIGSVFLDTRQLLGLVAEHSNIFLDGQPETYYLATATGLELPNLIDQFISLHQAANQALVNGSLSQIGLTQVLLASGTLKQFAAEVVSQLHSASHNSQDSQAYKSLIAGGEAIEQRITHFTKDVQDNFIHADATAKPTFFEVSQMAGPFYDEYRNVWNQTNLRFSILLEQRQSAINRKIVNLILMAVASVLLSLGLAIAMFRSTLRRLDGVELARNEAVSARRDAEELANSISTINEDVVRMNHELSESMGKLKNAQDELVKKGRMEQMGQLTATIAHELRNPLGAVRTSAFLIERKIRDKGLGVEPQLVRINNGITRCDNIITQLLDFSRTKQLTARPDDLDQWLAKTIEEEAKSLPAVVEIQCSLGLDGRHVPFDPSRLQRAIINLVSNASEAMVGNGEDPSRFAVANPIISITSQIAHGFALITVADNGPGISPENLTRIREPLFTTKSFGTGLGIPAVEQIATQHGGSLELTSELGKGAAFTIKIPLVHSEEEAA